MTHVTSKKDFLRFGLNRVKDEPGERYIANDMSKFSGTYFHTKKEAALFWQNYMKEEKTGKKQ
jgi:hypothetical protein